MRMGSCASLRAPRSAVAMRSLPRRSTLRSNSCGSGIAGARPGAWEAGSACPGRRGTSCFSREATIKKGGIERIKEELVRIHAMENMRDVVAELVRLHRVGIGVLFNFGARPDAKDSTRTIAGVGQGGLSLPDREYYLKTDAKSVETRQRFVAHMTKMFQLAGDSADDAADNRS